MAGKIRFAQLGVDHPHAAGFRESLLHLPEVDLVAFYDPDPARARSLLQPALQDRPLYGDVVGLLTHERPEAVLITLPNDVTPAAVVQAAAAGAHVYAEKPCARTAAEFWPAVEAIRRAGVQFATGYNRRHAAVGVAIKEIVDQGLLGQLTSVEARWITTSVRKRDPTHFLFSRERSGGGILHWLGCHWLDFMRWATSAEVTEVSTVMDMLSGERIDVEDTATLALRYSNGMLGSLHCAYITDGATNQLFFGLRGTLGWLNWPGSGPELEVRSAHPAWVAAATRVLRFTPDPQPGYGGAIGLVALRRFIASFRDGVPPAFTVDDALRVLEVLGAAQDAARTGRRVALAGTRRRVGEDGER